MRSGSCIHRLSETRPIHRDCSGEIVAHRCVCPDVSADWCKSRACPTAVAPEWPLAICEACQFRKEPPPLKTPLADAVESPTPWHARQWPGRIAADLDGVLCEAIDLAGDQQAVARRAAMASPSRWRPANVGVVFNDRPSGLAVDDATEFWLKRAGVNCFAITRGENRAAALRKYDRELYVAATDDRASETSRAWPEGVVLSAESGDEFREGQRTRPPSISAKPSAVFLSPDIWDHGGVEEWFRMLATSTAQHFQWTLALQRSPPTGRAFVERLRAIGIEVASGAQTRRALDFADVVIAWQIAPGVGDVPRTNAPVLAIAHGPDDWTKAKLDKQRASPTLVGVVGVSEACRRIAPDVIVVPNGVDLARLEQRDKAVDRQMVAIGKPGRPLAVFVGRLSDEKRPELAAEACRLAGVSIAIIGPANDPTMPARIERANPEAKLLGPVDAIGSVLAQADCLVIASEYEGGPLVALEAACAGVPIASTRVGLVPTLAAQSEAVILADDDSAASLAKAIRRGTTTRARAAARENRDKMRERWGAAAFGERWRSLLMQTIDAAKGAR